MSSSAEGTQFITHPNRHRRLKIPVIVASIAMVGAGVGVAIEYGPSGTTPNICELAQDGQLAPTPENLLQVYEDC